MTNAKNSPKNGRCYNFAALGFTVAGLIWCVGGLMTKMFAMYIAIGMMNVSVGMMFLAMSQKAGDPPQSDHA